MYLLFSVVQVGKMVIAFVVIFIVCFLPYHTFMLWFHFYPFSKDVYDDFWHAFRIVGFCLSFINSCVNPIALYCVSGAFRKRSVPSLPFLLLKIAKLLKNAVSSKAKFSNNKKKQSSMSRVTLTNQLK